MDWIPIGESIPVLTPNQERILQLLAQGKSHAYIRCVLRMRTEALTEELYDIRRKQSIMGYLTSTQKAAIYQAAKDGTTQAELARQYGISSGRVSQIIKEINKLGGSVDGNAVNIAALPEKKPAAINQDFENAVDQMIAEAKEKDANAEENAENAEENFANAKPEPLPPVVLRAVNQHLQDIADHIEALRGRIDEIELEIEEYQKDAKKLEEWKGQQKWR